MYNTYIEAEHVTKMLWTTLDEKKYRFQKLFLLFFLFYKNKCYTQKYESNQIDVNVAI